MLQLLHRWRHPTPPALDATPTYWQLRRYCRWQAQELWRLARRSRGHVARQAQARTQAAWIEDVLRHHPLRDDLLRTLQQSADLLRVLAADTVPQTP
jgi:hypothetical protein